MRRVASRATGCQNTRACGASEPGGRGRGRPHAGSGHDGLDRFADVVGIVVAQSLDDLVETKRSKKGMRVESI
jgi:hypothetical protein